MDFLTQLFTFFESNEFAAWIAAITGVLVAVREITKRTPATWDDGIINTLLSMIGIIAPRQSKDAKARISTTPN